MVIGAFPEPARPTSGERSGCSRNDSYMVVVGAGLETRGVRAFTSGLTPLTLGLLLSIGWVLAEPYLLTRRTAGARSR